jgi:hypothetical protein
MGRFGKNNSGKYLATANVAADFGSGWNFPIGTPALDLISSMPEVA